MRSITQQQFIQKAIKIHGNVYDYSKVNYVKSVSPVEIICKLHGPFYQTPHNHMHFKKCNKCALIQRSKKRQLSQEEFISRSKKIHSDRYDYSMVNYDGLYSKVTINCHIHGEFQQTPKAHIGKSQSGCPKCSASKGEKLISDILIELHINFIRQHKFPDCRFKHPLVFDFYIPDHNICIEYDGEQHFKPIKKFGGNTRFLLLKKRDSIKNDYCMKKSIKLLRISYKDKDIKEIIKKIMKHG